MYAKNVLAPNQRLQPLPTLRVSLPLINFKNLAPIAIFLSALPWNFGGNCGQPVVADNTRFVWFQIFDILISESLRLEKNVTKLVLILYLNKIPQPITLLFLL